MTAVAAKTETARLGRAPDDGATVLWLLRLAGPERFDAGVGVGGLMVGTAASAAGPTGALDSAAAAVATVALATAITAKAAGHPGAVLSTALTRRGGRSGRR